MEPTTYSKLYSDDSPPVTMQHSSSCGDASSVGNGGFGCIEHTVTKYDTLAGVAIKYGVEVADIKRMNALTTDLHMFARKSLRIPLPGRHPPSPIMSNGKPSPETTPPNSRHSNPYNSIQSLRLSSSPNRNASRPINSLRDCYRLTPNTTTEGFELCQTPLGFHRKSKSEANGFSMISGAENGPDKSIEKLVRRRKSEVDGDVNTHTPETALPMSGGKGLLALRPKTANRASTEMEPGSSAVQAFSGVRKSSSAPSFQNSETSNGNGKNNGSLSSLASWRTSMLNFTFDFQALSTAAIASPLFDGLPKPSSGRKKKPARD